MAGRPLEGIECAASSRPASRQRRLTKAERQQIVEQYQTGARVKDLAGQFGVRRATIGAVLDQADVLRRPRGLCPAQIDQAVTLYGQGLSLARIGERFDVEAHTVRSALLRRGVRMRDTHGRQR